MKLFFLSLHGLPLAILSTSCLASGSGSFRSGGTASGGGAQGDPNGPVASSYGGPADPSSSSGAPVGPAAGPAEPRWDDFAFAVRERSGSYNAPWVITKLTTFKVGKTCYAKLGSKDSDSLNNTAYYTRSVLALAKAWTGNDWDQIENQHTDRAKDRSLVEPMMDEFAKRFHMTIAIEGDDCEVDRRGLWIRDWYSIGEAFEKYPPAAGKLFITLNLTAAARDITVEVDESGSQFTFTAPRDIEAPDWTDKLQKPFRRYAAKL